MKKAAYFKLRFTICYRDVKEILANKGVKVDHSTIQKWVFNFTKEIEYNINRCKK
jgi:putative transposase